MRRLIAWRLQADVLGDLDEGTQTKIKQLARSSRGGTQASFMNLKAGSILVREWRGVEQRVLVLDQGFEHKDKRYKSLSEVARAITGTHWSGPRFFGLEPKHEQRGGRP